ncbi:hypothetical protein EON63_17065 [archaeon]|nr:MAG: hypothetical protein EON63_17065 [archaeon]
MIWQGDWHCSLQFDGQEFPCVLGKNGAVSSEDKMEGDGKTPLGAYQLRRAFYRADKTTCRDCKGAAKYLNCEATLPYYIWVCLYIHIYSYTCPYAYT